MPNNAERYRAKKAAFLALQDRENIKKNGGAILRYYRSGLCAVEIAAYTNQSENTAIRISAIRNFINRVESIVELVKANSQGLSTQEIAQKLNIDTDIVLEELQWFQQSKIIDLVDRLWIHRKYQCPIEQTSSTTEVW